MSKKILIIGNENCGLIHNLALGFCEMSFSAKTAIFQRDIYFSKIEYDYKLFFNPNFSSNRPLRFLYNLVNKLLYLFKLVHFKYCVFPYFDIYVYVWRSLSSDFSDLNYLKRKNKKIIFYFIGSEIRWKEAFRQNFPKNNYPGHSIENGMEKIRLLRNVELNASSIFAGPDFASLMIRGYFLATIPLNLGSFRFINTKRSIPKIIHAPTNRDVKGTSVILSTLNKLKENGCDFHFELIENVDNEVLKLKLSDSDILVDQIYLNGPATLAAEAMASGCAVAARFSTEHKDFKNAPICYIDDICIYEQLKKLISDFNYRQELIKKSTDFLQNWYSLNSVCLRILNSIEGENVKKFDFSPNFYINEFKFPYEFNLPQDLIDLTNRVYKERN